MVKRLAPLGNDVASFVIMIDHDFGENQCVALLKELEVTNDAQNEYTKLAYKLITSIRPIYGDGFAIIFDERITSLPSDEIKKLLDEVEIILSNSEFMNELGFIKAVKNELEDIVDEIGSDIIQRYLDALTVCSYSISKNSLHELFDDYFPVEKIDKVIVFNLMKNPKLFSS